MSVRLYVGRHFTNANRVAGCLPSHLGWLRRLYGFLHAVLANHNIDTPHLSCSIWIAPTAARHCRCVFSRHGARPHPRLEVLDCQIPVYLYVRSIHIFVLYVCLVVAVKCTPHRLAFFFFFFAARSFTRPLASRVYRFGIALKSVRIITWPVTCDCDARGRPTRGRRRSTAFSCSFSSWAGPRFLFGALLQPLRMSITPLLIIVVNSISSCRYLRQIRDHNKLGEERVLNRVGFLFSQYREEYLYVFFVWTRLKTVVSWLLSVLAAFLCERRQVLWRFRDGAQVVSGDGGTYCAFVCVRESQFCWCHDLSISISPQVAFFPAGSMLQLALSVLVSVAALVYHIYARPFRDSWLNGSWFFLSFFFLLFFF